MTAYVVGWTKPREVFPHYTTHPTRREAEAAHKLALRIDPDATIAPLAEEQK